MRPIYNVHPMRSVFSQAPRLMATASLSLLLLSTAGNYLPTYAEDSSTPIEAPATTISAADETAALTKTMTEALSALVKEHYARAKISSKGNKIHFEYKVRPFAGVGGKESIVPDLGGVLGDLQIVDGEYSGKVRLPQQFNEHAQYSIILMAPYSPKHDCHLYTRLSYPYDVQPEFLERFKELANKFAELTESIATSKPPRTIASSTTGGASNSTDSSVGSGGTSEPSTRNTATAASAGGSDKIKLTMWKLQKGSQTIYLLGTIPYHATEKTFYPLSPEIEAALDQSKQLLVDNVDIKKALPVTDKRIYSLPSEKLSNRLSAPTREALEKYLSWSGDSLEMYEIFKPWFASVAMDNSVSRQSGFHPTNLKQHVIKKARSASKPVIELESGDSHIKLLESLSPDAQDKMLRNSIVSLMNFQDEQSQLEDGWRSGDEKAIQNASLSASSKDQELVGVFEDIISEQNAAISSRIVELSKGNSPLFIALDSRRLVGDSGLVALLKKDGYSSEQMSGSLPGQALATASSQAGPPLEANFGSARLQRFTYPEGRFSIMLPGKPSMNFSNVDGQRRVDYTYKDPQGAMFVGYIITPGIVPRSALPTVLSKIAGSLSKLYNPKETKQYSITVAGHPGRQLEFTSVTGKVGKDSRLRLIVAGNFVYILGAEGTSPWVKSPGVKQFFDSLAIAPAEVSPFPSLGSQTSGFGAPSSFDQRMADAIKKQNDELKSQFGFDPNRQPGSNRPWGTTRSTRNKPWGQSSSPHNPNAWGR